MPKLQLSVLKVVGTHNFDAQKSNKFRKKSDKVEDVEMTNLIR